MLDSTKEQIKLLVDKVNLLSFIMETLKINHTDYQPQIDEQFKQASTHKVKLTSEILRLLGADSRTLVK